MNNFIKKHINIIITIFLLLQPILDLLTGLCLHTFNINLTIGIIIRVLFMIFICIITLFTFKKKNILIPYLIIGIYCLLYTIGILLFKDVSIFKEIQSLVKVFYFPIILISLYSIKDEIRISKLSLLTVLFLYLIFIFIPLLFNIGYDSYEVTKKGTLGFYNSANEISGLISLLTPIMFIIIFTSKNLIPKIILFVMYLVVILMIGTKTPLLALIITIGISVIYYWINLIKQKKYKNILISLLIIIISTVSLILVIPKTNFYKNIKIHLDYLGLNNITEVFKDEKLIDHFIFSSRLKFLDKKMSLYKKSNTYQKLFGIGYMNNNKPNKANKLIEIDYFDILFSHGIIGFIILFGITIPVIISILRTKPKKDYEYLMLYTSLLLIIVLSFFTGHIITAPSVSLICIILIISLNNNKKKYLLFASKNMHIGGIEKASLNLLNSIDYNKYNVTLVLEEKEGELLNRLNENVTVKEVKVSNNNNVIIRKLTNVIRKLIFKIFNYHNYDFSCCYTTYSYSCNKLAKMSSINNSFYVHSDYKYVYSKDEDFKEFFDSRKVDEYKTIIFVSNESRKSFISYYPNLKDKCIVLNNLIDTEEILSKSNEEISVKKPTKNKILVFVGRLDDSSKKLKRAINLIKEIDELELWVIGDGPDREMYEDFAKPVKKKVTFFGKQLNPYPYMKQADYIILTSDYEGFPVTYLEAITLEKDIITTLPTSDDSIDINDYAYVISKDEKEMVKQVKNILNKKTNKKQINIKDIQTKRIKKFEKLFNK